MSVSVFMALSTAFHSMNPPDNSLLSHSILSLLFLPYWFCQLYILMKVFSCPDIIFCGWYCFCAFLLYTFLKSGIDRSMEWSTIPACPSPMCFFNRGYTKGTDSSKILCLMFVYVLFYVNLYTGLILWFLNNLWFDDLRAE